MSAVQVDAEAGSANHVSTDRHAVRGITRRNVQPRTQFAVWHGTTCTLDSQLSHADCPPTAVVAVLSNVLFRSQLPLHDAARRRAGARDVL